MRQLPLVRDPVHLKEWGVENSTWIAVPVLSIGYICYNNHMAEFATKENERNEIPRASRPIVWDKEIIKLAHELAEDLRNTRKMYEQRGPENSNI